MSEPIRINAARIRQNTDVLRRAIVRAYRDADDGGGGRTVLITRDRVAAIFEVPPDQVRELGQRLEFRVSRSYVENVGEPRTITLRGAELGEVFLSIPRVSKPRIEISAGDVVNLSFMHAHAGDEIAVEIPAFRGHPDISPDQRVERLSMADTLLIVGLQAADDSEKKLPIYLELEENPPDNFAARAALAAFDCCKRRYILTNPRTGLQTGVVKYSGKTDPDGTQWPLYRMFEDKGEAEEWHRTHCPKIINSDGSSAFQCRS